MPFGVFTINIQLKTQFQVGFQVLKFKLEKDTRTIKSWEAVAFLNWAHIKTHVLNKKLP